MERAIDILVMTHDLAAGIDVKGVRERRARDVDGNECALVEQKAMLDPPGIYVRTHDLAGRVNPESSRVRGLRKVDGGESALVEQKAMADAFGVRVGTDDLAPALILSAEVDMAPGTSIVVKVNALAPGEVARTMKANAPTKNAPTSMEQTRWGSVVVCLMI